MAIYERVAGYDERATDTPTDHLVAKSYGANGLMVSGVQEVVPHAPNPSQS